MSRLRVDFHCRVILMCLYTHVNFTRVNKIEARYEVLRLNVKLTKVQLLCLRGKTFHSFTLPQERIKGLYPLLIASILNANINFTNVRTQKLRGSGNPPWFRSDKIQITFFSNLQIPNYGWAIFRKIRTVHMVSGTFKILYNSYFDYKYSQTSKCDQLSLATTSH